MRAKTGTSLPVACGIGEAHFLTTALLGQIWYRRKATDIWAVQGAEGAVNNVSDVRFIVTNTSPTVLTLNGAMSSSNPTVIRGHNGLRVHRT